MTARTVEERAIAMATDILGSLPGGGTNRELLAACEKGDANGEFGDAPGWELVKILAGWWLTDASTYEGREYYRAPDSG